MENLTPCDFKILNVRWTFVSGCFYVFATPEDRYVIAKGVRRKGGGSDNTDKPGKLTNADISQLATTFLSMLSRDIQARFLT